MCNSWSGIPNKSCGFLLFFLYTTHKPSSGKDPNIETKSLEWSGGQVNVHKFWSPGQARAFFQALSIYTGVMALQRLTTMLRKAWPRVMSDSVMRFLQHINKQAPLVDFLLRSVNVFLFLCSRAFWIWVWAEARDREQIMEDFSFTRSNSKKNKILPGVL